MLLMQSVRNVILAEMHEYLAGGRARFISHPVDHRRRNPRQVDSICLVDVSSALTAGIRSRWQTRPGLGRWAACARSLSEQRQPSGDVLV